MNKNILYIIPFIFIALSVSIPLIVNAQIENQDRTFIDSCDELDDNIDEIREITGSEISYDIAGCPNTAIIIHNWDSISIEDQQLIRTELTAKGYEEQNGITE
jgi:hypothetical protein